MAHWPHEVEREDGDGRDEDHDKAVKARQWLRQEATRSANPNTRAIVGELAGLELAAQPFYLGVDHDDDYDDVDEMGPF